MALQYLCCISLILIDYCFILDTTDNDSGSIGNRPFNTQSQNDFLCHWRYKYDPPEYQTVLASTADDSTFHIGYFRDDPKEMPAFLASAGGKKRDETHSVGLSSRTKLSVMGDNLFGAVFNYIQQLIQTADPFKQTALNKMKEALHIHATIKLQVHSGS